MLAEMILAMSVGYENPIKANDAYCMAEAIYMEARNQPIEGKAAVAVTILNRVDSKRFPNSICKVIYQRKQFSYTLAPKSSIRNTINTTNILDLRQLSESTKVALQTLDGGFKGMHQSLHYFNPSVVSPNWAKSFSNSFIIADHKWVY